MKGDIVFRGGTARKRPDGKWAFIPVWCPMINAPVTLEEINQQLKSEGREEEMI